MYNSKTQHGTTHNMPHILYTCIYIYIYIYKIIILTYLMYFVHTHLNLPIRLRCENISPPGTNSKTMYKFELS